MEDGEPTRIVELPVEWMARRDNVVIHHVHLTDELKTLLDDVM